MTIPIPVFIIVGGKKYKIIEFLGQDLQHRKAAVVENKYGETRIAYVINDNWVFLPEEEETG